MEFVEERARTQSRARDYIDAVPPVGLRPRSGARLMSAGCTGDRGFSRCGTHPQNPCAFKANSPLQAWHGRHFWRRSRSTGRLGHLGQMGQPTQASGSEGAPRERAATPQPGDEPAAAPGRGDERAAPRRAARPRRRRGPRQDGGAPGRRPQDALARPEGGPPDAPARPHGGATGADPGGPERRSAPGTQGRPGTAGGRP